MTSSSSSLRAVSQMWGGRFAAKPSELLSAINASIDVDRRLWREDIDGSLAHADMLAACGVITPADRDAIRAGLEEIAQDIEEGRFSFSQDLEDIHLNIEARLTERIGEAGKRLHTARSRNDQVATGFKLWTMRALTEAEEALRRLQVVLVAQAEAHADWVMPGFTHMQTAQPVTLGHHLMAYVEMFERDVLRLSSAAGRVGAGGCPLGAAALAGTSFPIDRDMTAEALGFPEPMANSLDAVASRDFALDALAALAIAASNLSRLAEELVLWTSPQFAFAKLADEWSTGSSIMPQKRNPDAAELVRAKATRIAAEFQALINVVGGLPLAYAKDLQEDKPITFAAFDHYHLCVAALEGMIATARFDRAVMRAAAARGYSTATDLADWLVRTLAMPFRDAHHVTGAIVRRAEAEGAQELSRLPLAVFQAIEPRITAEAVAGLSVEASVESRGSYGGAAPARVREQIARWKALLAAENDG